VGREEEKGENNELKGSTTTQETGEELWAHIFYLPVNALTSKTSRWSILNLQIFSCL